jgi:hypothetical protein
MRMTIREARAKFPKAHLVWVGTNHCWTFGTVHVHSHNSIVGRSTPFSHNPTLWRWRYCEALGGILVEFLVQQKPANAECFADLTATTAALI